MRKTDFKDKRKAVATIHKKEVTSKTYIRFMPGIFVKILKRFVKPII